MQIKRSTWKKFLKEKFLKILQKTCTPTFLWTKKVSLEFFVRENLYEGDIISVNVLLERALVY